MPYYFNKYIKYKHKYLREKNKIINQGGNTNKMTYVFGDSFSGPFTLINNPKVYVKMFKGATAKGLSKPNNENRITIENILADKTPKCLIFYFGNVDALFSYFYVTFVEKKTPSIEEFTSEIVQKYVDFIKSFQADNTYVITITYNPFNDEYFANAIKKYSGLPKDIRDDVMSYKDEINQKYNRELRNQIIDSFNDNLKKMTQDTQIKVADLNQLITHNGLVDEKYIDTHSKYNIHLRWEPLMPVLIQLFDKCGIKEKYLENLEKSEKKYFEYKEQNPEKIT